MDWPVPVWAHIPLIHGPDGKKLSKRHGALGVEDWRAMGYPAGALRNYLARLGWSHGDDEVFTDAQALAWFDLDGIGRAPARLDLKKLDNLAGRHIAAAEDAALLAELVAFCAATQRPVPDLNQRAAQMQAMPGLKERAKTYVELLEKAHFLMTHRPIGPDQTAAAMLDEAARGMLADLTPHLRDASWNRETLEAVLGAFAAARDTKFGKLAGPLRAALAGRSVTPSVYDMMLVLGRDETLARLSDAAAG
jgi:glutamyl-tRNA synthetase